MPIIKSAKKRAKQDIKKRIRNHAFLSNMRSLVKNIFHYAEKGELEKVVKNFAEAESAVDKCAKKNLIHKNNAARKKARMYKAINKMDKKDQSIKIEKLHSKNIKKKSSTKVSKQEKK